MQLLGLIPEDPFDPRSWSGSAAPFFTALRASHALETALEVRCPRELLEKARVFGYPMARWKERYHASVSRFECLTRQAGRLIELHARTDAVMQVGAWFSSGSTTTLPCFSYHDGNAAEWYRHYDRDLLTEREKRRHLEWEHSVYQSMRGIFVMSSWLARSFVNDFNVSRTKVHVVGAGINMPLPAVPQRDFSKARFLFVGRDFERKGGRYLLEAFRKVRKNISAELAIVGPALNLDEPGIALPGYLSKSDPRQALMLADLFSSATALILPSIYEPFGISLTEGMAWGLPCITVNRCAMPEIVLHGETGLVADAEDSNSLAHSMMALAGDPERCRDYGVAGRRRVENHFTWSAVIAKIRNVLSTIYGIS